MSLLADQQNLEVRKGKRIWISSFCENWWQFKCQMWGGGNDKEWRKHSSDHRYHIVRYILIQNTLTSSGLTLFYNPGSLDKGSRFINSKIFLVRHCDESKTFLQKASIQKKDPHMPDWSGSLFIAIYFSKLPGSCLQAALKILRVKIILQISGARLGGQIFFFLRKEKAVWSKVNISFLYTNN